MKLTSKGKCVDIIRWNLQGLELMCVQHLEVKAMKRNQQWNWGWTFRKKFRGHENSNVRKFIKEGKTMANMADRLNSMIFLSVLYCE